MKSRRKKSSLEEESQGALLSLCSYALVFMLLFLCSWFYALAPMLYSGLKNVVSKKHVIRIVSRVGSVHARRKKSRRALRFLLPCPCSHALVPRLLPPCSLRNKFLSTSASHRVKA